jgi:hypothetical protein
MLSWLAGRTRLAEQKISPWTGLIETGRKTHVMKGREVAGREVVEKKGGERTYFSTTSPQGQRLMSDCCVSWIILLVHEIELVIGFQGGDEGYCVSQTKN